jgi:hypothetical protein
LVKRYEEERPSPMCEEWCDVTPGDLPMWLMVKNYLLQYILLEATYLRSTCCVSGRRLLLLLAVRCFVTFYIWCNSRHIACMLTA